MKFSSLVEQFVMEDKKRSAYWFDKLDAEAQKEIVGIRDRYRAGQYGKTSKRSLARAIVAAAKERGWPVCGECGVREWLSKD